MSAMRTVVWLVLAGCVGVPDTLRDACVQTGDAWCARASECVGDSYGVEACRAEWVRVCCVDDGLCGVDVVVERDDWAACLDALDTMSCALDLPADCLAVARLAD